MKLELVCVIGIDITVIDPNSGLKCTYNYAHANNLNIIVNVTLTVLMMFTVILYEIHTHISL